MLFRSGLSTRLEALALAFLLSDRFGHEVCIDWHELDALTVRGTRRRGRGVLGRLNSLKLLGDASNDLARVPDHINVNLRTHHGPAELRQFYLPTARRVTLRADLVAVIRATFERYRNRPLVGVHIRRGDFPLIRPDLFDVNAFVWPAVPDWWYEHVMAKIQQAVPDVAFFVSCSGSLDAFPNLRKNFDIFDLPAASPYTHKEAGHASARHPAADLIALGCCDTLIASPCSTFSHYAANMLGRPTQILVPPAHPIHQAQPEFCTLSLHGRGAADWYAACRTGQGLQAVPDAASLRLTRGAFVDWM